MGRRNTRVDEMKRRAVPKMPTDKQLNIIRRRSVASSRNFAVSRLLRSENDGGDKQNVTVTTNQLNLQLRRPTGSCSRQDLHESFARHKLTLIASSTKPHKRLSSCECQVNDCVSPTLQWLDSSGVRINKDDREYTQAGDFGNYNPDKTKEFSQQGRNKTFIMFKVASLNSSFPKPTSYENVLNDTGSANLSELDSSRVRNHQDASAYFRDEEFNRHDPEKIKRGVTKGSNEGNLRIPSGDFTYVSKITPPKEPVDCGDDHRNYIVALRDLDLEQQKISLPGSTFPKKMSELDIPVTVIYSSSRPFLSASSRTTNISSLSSTAIPAQNASGVRYVEEYNKSAGILTYRITQAEREDERTTTSSSTSFIKEEDLDTFFLSEVLSQQSSNQYVGSEPLSSDLLSGVSELDVSLSNSSILSEELSPLPFHEAGLTTQSKLYLALLSDWEANRRGSSHRNPLPSCLRGVSVTPPPGPPSPPTPPPPPSQRSRRRLRIDLLATQMPSSPPPLPPILPPPATVVVPPKGPVRSQPPSPPPPPTLRARLPPRPLATPSLHPARLPPPPLPPPPPGRCSLSNLTPQSPRRVWPRLSMPAFPGKETSLLRPPPTTTYPQSRCKAVV